MSDRDAATRDGGGSWVATNRAALAIAVGSLLVGAVLALLSWWGVLEPAIAFLVARGVAIDTLPIYLLSLFLLIWLVVWSWGRLVSLLQ